jgi:molybdenum cofactor cytidylyltransferase
MQDPGRPPRPIVALVLAAGASSRMGRPKALLDFDGLTAIALVLRTCAEAGAGAAVVVTAPGGEAVRRACAGAPLPVIEAINPHPERGMLSSLQTGLRALPPAAAFLLFPVDYPVVPAAEVRRLIATFAAAPAPIIVPSYDRRRGHPALVDVALAPEFLALAEDQTARAVMAAHTHETVYVSTEDDRVLMDMDTPDDYARCLARQRAG